MIRGVLRFTGWTVCGLALGLALACGALQLRGYHALTVLSGSMEPTLDVGTVVLSQASPAAAARPGEIVTFSDPARPDRLISHRLMRMRLRGDTAYMTTRGDANASPEEWTIQARGTVGIVRYRVPLLGRLKAHSDGGLVRFGALAVMLLTGSLMLVELWRPSRRTPASSSQLADVPT